MKKIAFIGAGSNVFVRNLCRDILTYPALQDSVIALMDINEEKLECSRKTIEKIVAAGGYQAKIISTTSRAEALEGADGVICAIKIGSDKVAISDIDIPMEYGVDYAFGDTRGVPGIFRGLRTIPVLLDICRDVEKYCPEAILLNYTNPMSIICRALQEATKVKITGLCHSVQNTSHMLAQWIEAPYNEISFVCAGINHQAWFTEFKWNGRDANPLIAKAIENEDIYIKDIVRNEMFLNLGYYVTESSAHNSEYNPWFRKRTDLTEKYIDVCTSDMPGKHGFLKEYILTHQDSWKVEFIKWAEEKVNLQRSDEYAAGIFNAVFGDSAPFKFHGNVRNFGLIDNLPAGSCVEVPLLASKDIIEPIHVGALPLQVAALNSMNIYSEELAVEGALTGDLNKIYQACYYDPLASAVLSMEEIKSLVKDMFKANEKFLSNFSR